MDRWEKITQTALLGLSRQALAKELQEEAEVLGFRPLEHQADNLLDITTAWRYWRRSAWEAKAATTNASVEVAPEEEQPYCSARATMYLMYILEDNQHKLLPEFLAALSEVGQIAPPQTLVYLLEYGRKHKSIQPILEDVTGARGQWMTQFNEAWAYHRKSTLEEVWELGSTAARYAWLCHKRVDAPKEALAKLESVWPNESARIRLQLMHALDINPISEDEAFLEACLTQKRSKEVAYTAASLLNKRPESAYAQRMWARCQSLLQVTDTHIEAILPEACPEAWIRDGIHPDAQWLSGHVQATLLGQLIAATPPKYWVEHLGMSPIELLEYAGRSYWEEYLILAWARATQAYQDMDWLLAFHHFYTKTLLETRWERVDIKFLLTSLPNEVFNRLAEEIFADVKGLVNDNDAIVKLLRMEGQVWNETVSWLTLKLIRNEIVQSSSTDFNWNKKIILRRAAIAIPSHLYKEIAAWWAEDGLRLGGWQKDVDEFLATLRLREEMLAALKTPSVTK